MKHVGFVLGAVLLTACESHGTESPSVGQIAGGLVELAQAHGKPWPPFMGRLCFSEIGVLTPASPDLTGGTRIESWQASERYGDYLLLRSGQRLVDRATRQERVRVVRRLVIRHSPEQGPGGGSWTCPGNGRDKPLKELLAGV